MEAQEYSRNVIGLYLVGSGCFYYVATILLGFVVGVPITVLLSLRVKVHKRQGLGSE